MPRSPPPPLLPRVGVELELLAPPGRTRRDLAQALAGPVGTVRPFLHPDTEPALVPGRPVFHNLTLGFQALDAAGAERARCVDDLTLQADLDRDARPLPGWWRVVSDDRRLLHLVRRHGRADGGPAEALSPLAALFGVEVEEHEGGLLRVRDPDGAPLALAAPLPGERWRPCELVTPPLPPGSPRALHAALEALLAPARALGFTVPVEAAVHLHLDAAPVRDAAVFADLVLTLHAALPALKQRLGSNPANRRRGDWPSELIALVREPGFRALPWPVARNRLAALGLSKYCDVNLRNVVHEVPGKPTLEIRILPGSIHAGPVVEGLAAVVALLRPSGAC
ncbi:amidoligase family protein [Myxococcota bacterium]|nr:amidoligase family protein [Myxococcota bacterium]